MAEPTPSKVPLPLPELAPRAATYGALFTLGTLLLGIVLFMHNSLDKRLDRVEVALADNRRELADNRRELTDTRKEVAGLRAEFVEFRAETRAELRSLNARVDGIDKKLDAVLELLKESR